MLKVDFEVSELDGGFLPSTVLSFEEPRIPKEPSCFPQDDILGGR